VDGDRGRRGESADRLPPHRVVFVGGLQHAVDPELRHPPGGVVGIGVGPARPRLGGDVARGIIGEAPRAAGGEVDHGQPVGGRRIAVDIRRGAELGGQPVADPVIGIGERAVGTGRPRQAFAGAWDRVAPRGEEADSLT
jgi:hypothetical protein